MWPIIILEIMIMNNVFNNVIMIGTQIKPQLLINAEDVMRVRLKTVSNAAIQHIVKHVRKAFI